MKKKNFLPATPLRNFREFNALQINHQYINHHPYKEILPHNFLVTIRQKLQTISYLRTSMALLLDSLHMDNGNSEAMQTHINSAQSSRFLLSIGTLFGSYVGLSVLSKTMSQIALIRIAICRNLLILQQIFIETYS